MGLTRRDVLMTGYAGGAAVASALFSPGSARAQDEAVQLVKRLTGRTPTVSDRLHLVIPAVFPTGYTVPMELDIDSPMTEDDHVKRIRVFAPQIRSSKSPVSILSQSAASPAYQRASASLSPNTSWRSPRLVTACC